MKNKQSLAFYFVDRMGTDRVTGSLEHAVVSSRKDPIACNRKSQRYMDKVIRTNQVYTEASFEADQRAKSNAKKIRRKRRKLFGR